MKMCVKVCVDEVLQLHCLALMWQVVSEMEILTIYQWISKNMHIYAHKFSHDCRCNTLSTVKSKYTHIYAHILTQLLYCKCSFKYENAVSLITHAASLYLLLLHFYTLTLADGYIFARHVHSLCISRTWTKTLTHAISSLSILSIPMFGHPALKNTCKRHVVYFYPWYFHQSLIISLHPLICCLLLFCTLGFRSLPVSSY